MLRIAIIFLAVALTFAESRAQMHDPTDVRSYFQTQVPRTQGHSRKYSRSNARAKKPAAGQAKRPVAKQTKRSTPKQAARPAPKIVRDPAPKTVNLPEFNYIDPQGKVPRNLLNRALAFLKMHSDKFHNQSYMGIIDYTKHSSQPRFHIIDLKTGRVESYLTAHGKGSDPRGTGWANRFSNRNGSLASSVGFFRTRGVYYGKHGKSLRLEGLSSTNSNAYQRAVVIHPARYVIESRRYSGRSWGCPAVDRQVIHTVIDKLDGGALIYAYGGENPAHF